MIERLRIDDSRSGGGVVFQLSNQIKQHATPEHQMIMFLVPRNNETQLYMSFKQTCCLDLGLPSQCIKEAHFEERNSHKLNSVLTKVAAQMNTKLGGELWGVSGVNILEIPSLFVQFIFKITQKFSLKTQWWSVWTHGEKPDQEIEMHQ